MKRADGDDQWIIIGAGPAGLTAAYELMKQGCSAKLFEADNIVGGISRTESYKGYRFDIGGHRFFTKSERVAAIWDEVAGADMITRTRISRIYFNGRFFSYPLQPKNALFGLGPVEAVRILLSYLKAQLDFNAPEASFEDWVTKRFGRRLFEIFFKSYTEKVWGMPCSEIDAEWAAQRIKNLDLLEALRNALFGARKGDVVTSLIEEFSYPRLGPGMMWEKFEDLVAQANIQTHLRHEVVQLNHDDNSITSVDIADGSGNQQRVEGTYFLSSMPLQHLVKRLSPEPPENIISACDKLRYRDFLTVALIINKKQIFSDQWIYVHEPSVLVGRIQNFKNWSPEMVPDPEMTCLGLEYFLVADEDELWGAPDSVWIERASRELQALGLCSERDVVDGCVFRMPRAYPVYDSDYAQSVSTIQTYLKRFGNLDSIGRNGQHRYNNQDHSMLTGIYAVRNMLGENEFDSWGVNTEGEYHEEYAKVTKDDRLHPQRLNPAE